VVKKLAKSLCFKAAADPVSKVRGRGNFRNNW